MRNPWGLAPVDLHDRGEMTQHCTRTVAAMDVVSGRSGGERTDADEGLSCWEECPG
jgi:hypothetical protein